MAANGATRKPFPNLILGDLPFVFCCVFAPRAAVTFPSKSSKMASSSDCREPINSTLRLLKQLASAIAAIPQFSPVTAPISRFGAILKLSQDYNLQFGDSATAILRLMPQYFNELQDDIEKASLPGKTDWGSFKSRGRDITMLSSFLASLSTSFAMDILKE